MAKFSRYSDKYLSKKNQFLAYFFKDFNEFVSELRVFNTHPNSF